MNTKAHESPEASKCDNADAGMQLMIIKTFIRKVSSTCSGGQHGTWLYVGTVQDRASLRQLCMSADSTDLSRLHGTLQQSQSQTAASRSVTLTASLCCTRQAST